MIRRCRAETWRRGERTEESLAPYTPNARYQLNAIDRAVERDGHFLDVDMTYGSLSAIFKVDVTTVQNALDRL